jgi:hypothetical protein
MINCGAIIRSLGSMIYFVPCNVCTSIRSPGNGTPKGPTSARISDVTIETFSRSLSRLVKRAMILTTSDIKSSMRNPHIKYQSPVIESKISHRFWYKKRRREIENSNPLQIYGYPAFRLDHQSPQPSSTSNPALAKTLSEWLRCCGKCAIHAGLGAITAPSPLKTFPLATTRLAGLTRIDAAVLHGFRANWIVFRFGGVMLPPTVTGLADAPTGAAGSLGTPAGAGAMPGSTGTAPVGWPALGSAVVAGSAGGAMAGSAGGGGAAGSAGGDMSPAGGWLMGAGLSCATAKPDSAVVKLSIAALASMMDFIGSSFPCSFLNPGVRGWAREERES